MSIELNIKKIQTKINEVLAEQGRAADSVMLLAVSKTHSVDAIRQAYDAGIRDFGENYLQEAHPKMLQLQDLPIQWHMIGDIQSNKARQVAEHFNWVHTLSRIKIADSLNRYRTNDLPPLNVCIEVNIDNEKSKSGILPEDIASFAKELRQFPQLRLRGLMCIPAINKSSDAFLRLAQYQATLIEAGFSVDTLSMGMSDDYLTAIACGATIVRIGTGIFGRRESF